MAVTYLRLWSSSTGNWEPIKIGRIDRYIWSFNHMIDLNFSLCVVQTQKRKRGYLNVKLWEADIYVIIQK